MSLAAVPDVMPQSAPKLPAWTPSLVPPPPEKRTRRAITAAALLREVRSLLPDIRARASLSEVARRADDDTMAGLRDLGAFQLLQPRERGGLELGYQAVVDLAMTLGEASPAIGWLAAALNTGWMVASFSRRAQEDVWSGSPQALVATSLSPTREVVAVDGGFRISGTWKFTSGIDHADWVVLGGLFIGEGPEFRFFLVPRNDFRIVDDWHAMGLRGTGSATAVVESAFVPEHRTLLASHLRDGTTPGARLHANPLYRAPFGLTFPLTLAAAVVGAAKGGLRDWQEAIKARRQAGVFSASRYLPNQLRVSESACEVEAAEMLVERSMREAMKILRRSRAVGDERRARSYRDAGYAVKLCQRAMDRLLEAAGGSALYTGNGIERAFRDVHAAAAHASLRWDEAAERWGRAALGIAGSNRFF